MAKRAPAPKILPRDRDLPAMEVEVEGMLYPWYLAPFEFQGETCDGMEEERALYDRINGRDGKPAPKSQAVRRELANKLYRLSYAYYIHKHFKIRDKSFKMVAFDHWNKGQQKIYWAFLYQRKHGLPIRIIIVKPRQTGVSTLIAALETADALLYPNRQVACIADKKGHTINIFRIMLGFYESLSDPVTGVPADEVPQLQRCSERNENAELHLGAHRVKKAGAAGPVLNSKLLTFTAKAMGREHSFTVTVLHASEFPYWPQDRAAAIWTGFANAIPSRPETMQFLEGTSAGAGDLFNQRYDAAEAGKGQFLPVFFGWQDFPWAWDADSGEWMREYSRELPTEYRSPEGREQYAQQLLPLEKDLLEKFDLALEQIAWRRMTIEDDCSGDEAKFKQEYPSTAAEAFIAAGANVYPPDTIEHYMEWSDPQLESNKPLWTGNWDWDVEKDPVRIERPDGWTRVWRWPEYNHTYVIGADPAAGEDPRSDWCSAQVLHIPDNPGDPIEQVAHCYCNGGLMAFAEQVASIYRVYGEPLTIPEVTGLGTSLLLELQEHMQVHNVYRRRIQDKFGNQLQSKVGFSTNDNTKGLMVRAGRQFLNELRIRLHCRLTVEQMKSYVQRPLATKRAFKYEPARSDKHDDALDALNLAIMGIISQQALPSRRLAGVEPPRKTDGELRYERERAELDRSRVDPTMGAIY
jgi:hypothetical protein